MKYTKKITPAAAIASTNGAMFSIRPVGVFPVRLFSHVISWLFPFTVALTPLVPKSVFAVTSVFAAVTLYPPYLFGSVSLIVTLSPAARPVRLIFVPSVTLFVRVITDEPFSPGAVSYTHLTLPTILLV